MAESLVAALSLAGEASERRLREVADSLRAQEEAWAVLIGAGLSAGAHVPTWESFLQEAGDKFGVTIHGIAPDNYARVAQDCLDNAPDAADFWLLAESKFCVEREPTPSHGLLVNLPFSVFLTTNFDCLLDGPHSDVPAAPPRTLAYPDLPARHGDGGRLVYLHGRCSCGQPEGNSIDPDKIVLTADGYDRAYGPTAETLPTFIKSVFLSMRVLFIGFSFSDFPMRRLLDALRMARESQGRQGGVISTGCDYAIFPTEASPELTTDYAYPGFAYGVDPIFYANSDGRHEALPKILTWLREQVGATPDPVLEVGTGL